MTTVAKLALYLFFCVAKLGQVVDAVEHSPLVGHCCIQVVLLATLIHGDALKHQPL
jgi:hypothetical protein